MSTFTFQLDSDATNTSVAFQQALVLLGTSPDDLSTTQIAECQYKITPDELNQLLDGNGAVTREPFLKLTYDENEHPAEDTAGDVTYTMHATPVASAFDLIAKWDVQSEGAATAAMGYANQKPTSAVPAAGQSGAKVGTSDYTTAHGGQGVDVNGTASDTVGTLAFDESVLPKRVFSAFGADIVNLLQNESDLSDDVESRIALAISQLKAKFTDSGANKACVGYKLWTQAVEASKGDDAKTDRIENMIDAAAATGVSGELSFPFIWADGDQIQFDIKFSNGSGSTSSPDFDGAAAGANANTALGPHAEADLHYRMKLIVG